VIPTAEQLLAISQRGEGTLEEVPFGVLLQALAVHGRTLVVEVRRRQLAKKIVLEGGVTIDCRSNLAHETLGRFMVAAGKLGAEDFHAGLARSTARGVPLGEVLIEQGLVSPTELFKILQQNLAKKLLDLFTWREGEFRMLPEVIHPASPLKVKTPQLVITGITRFAAQEEVDAAVGPLVGRPLALHPSPPFPLVELRLSPRQALLTEALGRRPRMDELAAATGLPYDEITRLLYALAVIGVVVPADQLRSVAAPITIPPATSQPAAAVAANTAASPAPVPAASGATPSAALLSTPEPAVVPMAASPAEIERLGNEVMQAYLSFRKQDPFDLLGLPEEAALPQIDQSFLAFAERYAPWKFTAPDLAALEERTRDLFLAGARAYGLLADREQRETLLFRRKTLREERARGPATDHFAIKTDLLDPEVQYRKGRAAMDGGRHREAVQLFEFAADCDPQNGLYRAELAWARFRLSPSTASRRSLAELDEALRIDPRCGLAVFYAGEIHRELGNAQEAEIRLQKAIRMMAPDRRPIEALKALQTRKKR